MSVRVAAKVWLVPLSAPDKIVLLRLADAADDDGRNAYPSVGRMMRECGLSDRGVQKALRRLLEVGLIRVSTRADFSAKRPTVYQLDLATIDALANETTPEPYSGVSTPEPGSPPNHVRPTPEPGSGPPPNHVHPEPSLKTILEPSLSEDVDLVDRMAAIWREELGDVLASPHKMTAKRQRSAKARLQEDLGGSLEAWRLVCRRVRRSEFLTGGGQRGWRADFDWLLAQANLLKVIEGRYDSRSPPANGQRQSGKRDIATLALNLGKTPQ